MRTITHVAVHHTGAPRASSGSTLIGVNAHHRDKNWGTVFRRVAAVRSKLATTEFLSGSYIQYHYFIDADGKLHQTSDDSETRWHAKAANPYSIGVCLAGDFRVERPTDVQLGMLRFLVARLMQQYGIHPVNVLGHRAFVWTACPGAFLPATLLASIANGAAEDNRRKAETGESLIPGELVKNEGDPRVYVIGRSGAPLWIVDEAAFAELYGDFSKVRVVEIPLASSKVLRVIDN